MKGKGASTIICCVFWCNSIASGLNTLKFLLIKPYPFAQMVKIEFERLRDFPNISLIFNNLFDNFEFELWRKYAFSPTSFDHASPHVHCFNINRISRCPELQIHYTLGPGQPVHKIYGTREEARSEVFDYIEMFYNCRRRHGSSNQMPPSEYENQYYQRLGSV